MKKIIDIFKQKKIIIVLFVLVISIISTVIIVTKNNNIITKIGRRVEREEVTQDDISYTVYDNTTDVIKAILTVQRIDGIDSIEYLNNEGENIKIDCKGKKKVSIDMHLDLNKEYTIKVISNGEETTKTILLDDNYLDDYIKIIESGEDETGNKTIVVETDKNLERQKIYYGIGEKYTAWKEYTGEFPVKFNTLHILTNDKVICAKKQDEAGNIVLAKKVEEENDSIDTLNVFQAITNDGATLQKYGFSASWNGSEERVFQIGSFGAGHTSGQANFSSVFTMNIGSLSDRKVKAESIAVAASLWRDGSATVYSSTVVYYKDGTSQSSSTISSTATMQITLEDKEIDYITFNIWRL